MASRSNLPRRCGIDWVNRSKRAWHGSVIWVLSYSHRSEHRSRQVVVAFCEWTASHAIFASSPVLSIRENEVSQIRAQDKSDCFNERPTIKEQTRQPQSPGWIFIGPLCPVLMLYNRQGISTPLGSLAFRSGVSQHTQEEDWDSCYPKAEFAQAAGPSST